MIQKRFIEQGVLMVWKKGRLFVKNSDSPPVAIPQELLQNEHFSGIEDLFDWMLLGDLMLDELSNICLDRQGEGYVFTLQTGAMKPVQMTLSEERATELLVFLTGSGGG